MYISRRCSQIRMPEQLLYEPKVRRFIRQLRRRRMANAVGGDSSLHRGAQLFEEMIQLPHRHFLVFEATSLRREEGPVKNLGGGR